VNVAAESVPPVRLTFWHGWTGLGQKGLDRWAAEFEKANPGIDIQVLHVPENGGGLITKLMVSTVAGSPPDLVLFNRPHMAMWGNAGAFESLQPWVESRAIDPRAFVEATWKECSIDGVPYALPFNGDTRGLFWNKSAFREVGLDPERPPKTLDELKAYSDRLTKRDAQGHYQRIGFNSYWAASAGTNSYYQYAFQRGVEFISEDGKRATFDTPAGREAFHWMIGWARQYGVEELQRFTSSLGMMGSTGFGSGRIAMLVDGAWMVNYYSQYSPDLDYGVAPMPGPGPAGESVYQSWSGGFCLAIPRGTPHRAEAVAVAQFLTSAPVQESFGLEYTIMPVNRAAISAIKPKVEPKYRVFLDLLEHSTSLPRTPVIAEITEQLGRASEKILWNQISVDAGYDEIVREVQKVLNRWNTPQTRLVNWNWIVLAIGTLVGVGLITWGVWFKRKLTGTRLFRREYLAGYIFSAPWLIGLTVFGLGPLIVSVLYCFMDYPILGQPHWVGMKNFDDILWRDPLFWKSLANTFYYAVLSIPLGLTASLSLALLINRKLKGIAIFRTIFYLPSVVSGVAVCVLFMWIFNVNQGILNRLLEAIGIRGIGWLTDPAWAKFSLVLMGIWGIGGAMVVFLAALQGIPQALHEAALIDGAGPWARFWNVTFPAISPSFFFNSIIGVIGAFQVFTQAYVMTSGGPLDSTVFYAFYLFRQAFEFFRMGYASALAWILFVIVLIFTVLQFIGARKWVYYEGRD
jgi:multiple sugar transport system permease protein